LSVDGAELRELYVAYPFSFDPSDKILINGYQSWTESRFFRPDDHIPKLKAPFAHLINTTGDYTFYKNPARAGRLHSWNFAALQRATGGTYWLEKSQNGGFSIVEFDVPGSQVVLRKDVGGMKFVESVRVMDFSIRYYIGTEVFYFDPNPMECRVVKRPVSGWTSWYNYYTKIDEGIILDNLRAYSFRDIQIDFFQIDDGWQPAVGDWQKANGKFPQGMKFLADQIHRYGYKAGLWLAPLIVEKDSEIFVQHRHWLLTHDGERLVEAGYNPGWGGLLNGTYYVLDHDLPEVQAHLHRVFDTVLGEWGFDLVKLDFLFAAGLLPHNGKSRGQRMYSAMQLLRECCGDKLILGCGVPLAAAWGLVDYCRIGPDVGLNWDMRSAKLVNMRERISTYNAMGNAIARRHFSGRMFANDPDVFILRKHNNDLSPQQRHSLLLINQIFGDLLFTSDDIGAYDAETMRLYLSTFPVLQKEITFVEANGDQYRVSFSIGKRSYWAIANLGRLDKQAQLPKGTWYRNGEGFVENPGAVYLLPYETRVYLQLAGEALAVAGSDLHIFPGAEVEELQVAGEGISVKLSPQCKVSGTLVLKVLSEAKQQNVNGKPYPVRERGLDRLVMLEVKDGLVQ
jgi:alpha-galactosidase